MVLADKDDPTTVKMCDFGLANIMEGSGHFDVREGEHEVNLLHASAPPCPAASLPRPGEFWFHTRTILRIGALSFGSTRVMQLACGTPAYMAPEVRVPNSCKLRVFVPYA